MADAKAEKNLSQLDSWGDLDRALLKSYRPPAHVPPLHCLGDCWSKWVSESAESKSASADFVMAALLASTSALIGNAYAVSPWGGWVEPAIFWACCVGNPSSGKTPAINAVMDLIRKLEAVINPNFEADQCEYEKLKRLSDIAKKAWEDDIRIARINGKEIPALHPRPPEMESSFY